MSAYELIDRGVFHLDAQYVEPGVASLYCVVHNDEVAIIETGTSLTLPHVIQFLADQSIDPKQVRYVVPTHVHLDHAGGAGAMMLAFPEAELIIHPRGARHMISPEKLVAGTIAVYGEETFHKLYGEIPPIEESRVVIGEHESTFNLGNREFLVVDTPGHAYHHFCIIDDYSKGIFTGDTFGLSYPGMFADSRRVLMPTSTPIHFNPEAMHESVDLLMSYQPERLYLTHFNMLPDPANHVASFHRWIDRYVELTEQVAPSEDSDVATLIDGMESLYIEHFGFSEQQVKTKLAMDIRLNCQGLAVWYQNRDD